MRPLVTTLLALLLLAPAWSAPAERSLVLVQWTDVHYGNEEWDPAAWHAALDEGTAMRPDAILLTGDNADNKCSAEEFRRRTQSFLEKYTARIRKSGAPVLLSLGNNDFGANYQSNPENLAPVLAAYRRAFGKAWYLDDLGNGTYPGRVGGMTWISINSLVFSPLNQYENRGEQAERTFSWLESEMERQPAGHPLVLLTHIPPTWDLYGHNPAWDPQFLGRLQSILEARKGPVVIVAGHFHRNEVHAFSLSDGRAVPVLDAGSLSLKYGNRANWRSYLWSLDPRSVPVRMTWRIRYPQHPEWNALYSVDRPFLSRTWSDFVNRLASDKAFYERYMVDFWAHNPAWRTDAGKPDNRDGLLNEFFVRPSLGSPVKKTTAAPREVVDACCGGH